MYPICLPKYTLSINRKDYTTEDISHGIEGRTAKILGWGETKVKMGNMRRQKREAGESISLQEAYVNILSNTDCQHMLQKYHPDYSVHENQLCAYGAGQDACQGDSGGPLFLVEEGRAVQEGIISLGEGCGDKRFPAIYISLRKFLDWIVLNTDGEDIWSFDCTNLNLERVKHQKSLIHRVINKKVTNFPHEKTTSRTFNHLNNPTNLPIQASNSPHIPNLLQISKKYLKVLDDTNEYIYDDTLEEKCK